MGSCLKGLDRFRRPPGLGLSLEEIGDLTELWEGDECGPVQRRLADFVAGKLAVTRAQVAELSALADRLQAVASRLAQEPEPGPCDESCACHSPVDAARQDSADSSVACTLSPAELPGRLYAWNALMGRVVDREPLNGGVRLRFPPDPGLAAELAGLAQAEQGCCAFFDFTVGIGAGALTLDVRGPGDAQPVIVGLFGAAS